VAVGVVLSTALAGCGASAASSHSTPPTTTTAVVRTPALCRSQLRVRELGHVASSLATELSGLIFSPSGRDLLWAENDSGNSPSLLGVTPTGQTVAEVTVSGAQNIDWEDIATGPDRSILIGDIGDNLAERPSIVIYRIAEPTTSGTVPIVARYELRYPDGAHDAETLLYDRSSRQIVIVTKSWAGRAGVYVTSHPSTDGVTILRRTGRFSLGAVEPVTGGDVSADTRTIVLRTYDSAFLWRRQPGETVAGALRRRPCHVRADLSEEGQGESLALTRDAQAFLTVPEGDNPLIRRYSVHPGRS
jgi:hypothetical protein